MKSESKNENLVCDILFFLSMNFYARGAFLAILPPKCFRLIPKIIRSNPKKNPKSVLPSFLSQNVPLDTLNPVSTNLPKRLLKILEFAQQYSKMVLQNEIFPHKFFFRIFFWTREKQFWKQGW